MPRYEHSDRPKCTVKGCSNPAHLINDCYDGTGYYRTVCGTHHRHTWHPTLSKRKDYCENKDGRLGYKCTTKIVWNGMLDVDHIDGDPSNDRSSNLQTLCKCCHSYKTHLYKDFSTPGRAALGVY